MLSALLALPSAAAVWRLAARRRARYAIAFTNLEVLAAVRGRRSWRRLVAPSLLLLAVAAAAGAVARPYLVLHSRTPRSTVILVLDTSGSMEAKDVAPTRLGAAQSAVRAFLARIPGSVQVGVIALGSEPQIILPPTADHRVAGSAVGQLTAGGGTAIGDTLAAAVAMGERATATDRRLAASADPAGRPGRLFSILLLSDGSQTDGFLGPLAAARQAAQAGVRVDTIALGTRSGTVASGSDRAVPVPPDPTTLAAIARLTGGRFTDATSSAVVHAAYTRLSTRFERHAHRAPVGFALLAAAAALLTGALAAGTLTTRLP